MVAASAASAVVAVALREPVAPVLAPVPVLALLHELERVVLRVLLPAVRVLLLELERVARVPQLVPAVLRVPVVLRVVLHAVAASAALAAAAVAHLRSPSC